MRLVQRELDKDARVVTVWFNAWRYEQDEHPIVPLVGTIVRELERHKSFRQRLAGGGQSLMRALRAVAYGFSAKTKVKVPGFAEIEAGFVAKEMIDREEKLTPDPLLDRSLYYDAFESLGSVKLGDDCRIVVLIDDLDRCFPDQAIRLLESIKLVLSQPGFIFLIGVARQVIEGYLQHRYSTEFGIADFQGQLYLDKVVQLPFFIPPNTERMEAFCGVILNRVAPEVRAQLGGILPGVGEAFGGNPRAIIRFINNILIDLAINTDLAEAALMERIPIEFFALSRFLQQRWPGVFSTLMTFDQLAEEVAGWDRDAMRANVAASDPYRAALATGLLSDLGLQSLLLGPQGKPWLINSSLRHASVNFLRSQQRISPRDPAAEPRRYDVFLSFAKEDSEEVSRIAEFLADHGLRLFTEGNIQLGDNWQEEIVRGLRDSLVVCVFIGASGRISEWRAREITLALDATEGSKPRVIPILLPGADAESVPSSLSKLQWLDLRSGVNTETLRQLVEAIKPSHSAAAS